MRDVATVLLGRTCGVCTLSFAARVKLSAVSLGLLPLLLLGGQAAGAYTVVAEHGPVSNRVNMVFMGDGYTAEQIETTYVAHIDTILDHMFNAAEDPFPRYANFFNIYRVDVISNESGADAPPEGVFRDTALDATYYWDGTTQRFLFINTSKAVGVRNAALAGSSIYPHINLVTVNDTRYGGGGDGTFAVCAGGNNLAGELALHEMGHSFSHLADEYYDPNVINTYTGSEPGEVNVTIDPAGQKWSRWLGYDQGTLGVVGTYEGARYYAKGLYRSSVISKMSKLGWPFNAVCREKIIQDIYSIVRPIDSCLGGGEEDTLTDPQNLWVDLVDPNVINIDWYVNGKLVPSANEEVFSLADFGYGPGSYHVKARAFDATDWVRDSRTNLEQWVQWDVQLTPEPSSAAMLLLGVLAILRRTRRPQPAHSSPFTATSP